MLNGFNSITCVSSFFVMIYSPFCFDLSFRSRCGTSVAMFCSVLFCTVVFCLVMSCGIMWCFALYCGLCRVSNGSSKCSGNTCRQHEMWCCVLYCIVLCCTVLSYDRQLMLPANATSLFCRYPLGTWHKKFTVLCYVLLCPVRCCLMLLCAMICFVAYATCRMDTFCFCVMFWFMS